MPSNRLFKFVPVRQPAPKIEQFIEIIEFSSRLQVGSKRTFFAKTYVNSRKQMEQGLRMICLKIISRWTCISCLGLGLVFGFSIPGRAQDLNQSTEQEDEKKKFELPDVNVRILPALFPQDTVVDKKIVAGKKVTTIEKKELPPIAQNNFRQMLAEIPGLMVSEVNNESWASLTYRGMGDPHESFNILNLRNGIPSTPDPYGYPASYYVPPFEALERIEFVRGGAGLLFGPQPGGALNYILRQAPRGDEPSRFRTTNLGGSFGRYNSYTEYSQGNDQWGALLSLNGRGAEGFREANNFSKVINPRVNFRYSFDSNSTLHFDFDFYQGRFGEPGGLAQTAASNVLTLDDPRAVTLRNDQIELDRTGITLGWEKNWNADTSSLVEVWNSSFRRESFRQSLGGSPAFGGVALGTTNVIQDQRFYTTGLQARVQHDYILGDKRQTLTVHLQALQTDSPFDQEAGSTPTAREGTQTRDISRKTKSQALVVENAYQKDAWTVTPAARFEKIEQKINEKLNTLGGVPLRQETQSVTVGLLGLGIEYKTQSSARIYGNYSQGYKPPAFQDTVPLGTTDTISEDLQEARTENYEVGVRGSLQSWEYDLSVFQIDFSNIFGRVGANFQNVGRSRSEGLDILVARAFGSQWRGFLSASFLDARFVGGPLKGKENQYSPDQSLRAGITYAYGNRSFARFQAQSLTAYYGDDGNSPNQKLGSLTIADISGQHYWGRWSESEIHLNWGIQNIFDQDTPTRVRSNGYEPAQPRAFFGGVTLAF